MKAAQSLATAPSHVKNACSRSIEHYSETETMPAIDYSNLKPPHAATKDDGSSVIATTTPGAYIPFALLSGFFAALASVFAKLFTDTRTEAVAQWICHASNAYAGLDLCAKNHRDSDAEPNFLLLAIRGACFALIFASNALMWTLFTKALNKAASSVQVTVVNSAMNFCATAILGNFIFGEPLALQWWGGASMIIVGTLLMTRAQNRGNEEQKGKME